MIASREQTLPFQTKIFLTVFLVALVPVILCFALLLPALVSTSAAGQRDAANEQLALLTGRMEQVLSGMKTALDALAEDERILPALSRQERVQPRELYAALVERAAGMPEVSQLMLVDESGTCLCALRGQEEDAHRDTDWGALRMAQGEQVVFYSELGRIAAVRRAQTGYLLAEISGDDLGELLSDGLNPSYGVMLLSSAIVEKEMEATLLVNPRPTDAEFVKYSFPSKTMEYMASGTPVLTTDLPGMPREYLPYVNLIRKETPEGVADALREVLSRSDEELMQQGLQARRFVLETRNNVVQAEKILTMLESTERN